MGTFRCVLRGNGVILPQSRQMSRKIREKNKKVSSVKVSTALQYIQGGYPQEVIDVISGQDDGKAIQINKQSSIIDSFAEAVNSGQTILTASTYNSSSVKTKYLEKYQLTGKHAYVINEIDTKNKIVYITNPWTGAQSIPVPYDVFLDAFNYFKDSGEV